MHKYPPSARTSSDTKVSEKALVNNWIIKGRVDEKALPGLDFSPVFRSLMLVRGMTTPDNVLDFAFPSLGKLKDPSQMKGMKEACIRIAEAIKQKETIGVFADYDVDGVCSAALLHRFFLKIGYKEPVVFIPDRAIDGYGLNTRGIDELKKSGVSLLITADCGISATHEVAHAKALGMDVIITDHHEPEGLIPDALSVINPKQKDCPFFGEDLCGAGVVFHLIVALRAHLRKLGMENLPNLKDDLDIVAMATVADVVSLRGINRILVKEGLKVLNSTAHTGLSALAKISGIKNDVIARDIGFILGPRINAAGRISKARKAFELLITDDASHAISIAQELHILNRQRQEEEQRVLKDALSMIEEGGNTGKAIVVAGTNWHIGVIGIVASRLADRFSKPAIVISIIDGLGRGSGRSVEPIDLHTAVSRESHFLKGFGGHRMAVGFTIDADKILAFANALEESLLKTGPFQMPAVEVDLEISPTDITPTLLNELEMLAPFGVGNREPVFMIPDMEVIEVKKFGGTHLKVSLKHSGRIFNAIGFNMATSYKHIPRFVNVAFTPVKKHFNGHDYLHLNLKALSFV
ncbi:MAG: single-stranded-DNA-specific exonuclease RecJ [Deltaproteobacteria bacterium]|nr:single-stranded-DNA-specific exonuclease RecJ [Deltaproteobacteria bacterium]